ncbi:unnamed protein product [Brugia timori]|uniref:Uncharacterized protein n=1 Tax=Brugia timori TaxID=42155 RepID=A0A0R3QBK3_9BILA|nr:unnamed protein product [Brugia timori]
MMTNLYSRSCLALPNNYIHFHTVSKDSTIRWRSLE